MVREMLQMEIGFFPVGLQGIQNSRKFGPECVLSRCTNGPGQRANVEIPIPDLTAMIRQHQATGMIRPESWLILELALSNRVGKLWRTIQLINDQVSVHPVTNTMILYDDSAHVEFSGRCVFAFEN